MSMHNTNSLLKYAVPAVLVILLLIGLLSCSHDNHSPSKTTARLSDKPIKNAASNDSAAESLDTLTADLSTTKKQVTQITKDNEELKQQNRELIKHLQNNANTKADALFQQMEELKKSLGSTHLNTTDYAINTGSGSQAITTVNDLTQPAGKGSTFNWLNNNAALSSVTPNGNAASQKPKTIPYFTIPANSTSVHDRLMTALVGRIPVKGVVTDPYPFKIVFSDDTLAANGLRVPHLRQMIVSGYTEGDLNLVSVRGWVTSVTFVFDDGTIAPPITSNDNNIGRFSKENALGYLSDARGNPFIRGKLITNAPMYVAGNVIIDAGQGAANAYSQSQTTSQQTLVGTSTTTVTGSAGKYIAGHASANAMSGVQQWWHDREEQSFDAIYVPTEDEKGNSVEISVNFAKEIPIDYNPEGRKLNYANHRLNPISRNLD